MTAFEAQSRRAVERHLAALYERFESVPVEEDVVVNDPDFFEHGVRAVEAGRLASAGAWVTDGRGRLLLVRAEGAEQWGPPAGTREPDEPLVETARRETYEEAGVAVHLTGVRRVRKKAVVHAEYPGRRLHMAEAYFDAEPLGDPGTPGPVPNPDRSAAGEPIAEARWFETPPEAVADEFVDGVEAWAEERADDDVVGVDG